jgi:FSR family fosmidomycin resistance protein-like MFS transporter
VVWISICHFIHDVYSSFLSPLLPLLIEKLSMSLTQAGFLSTVLQLPAILNPYIGVWADRISVRYFIILAPAMTAIPMSLIGVAPSYGMLLMLLLAAGISVAIFHVPAPVLVSRLAGERVGRGMSLFMTGGELARAVGPLAAVGAVTLWGLEGFYPVMVFGIAASAWLMLRFREASVGLSRQPRTSVFRAWQHIRHIMIPLSFILVARGFMHAGMATFLPTYLNQETGNLWLAGAGLTLFETTGVIGVLVSGSASDYLGRRRVLLVALIGAPISMLLFTLSGGALRFVALLFVGFTLLATTPVMMATVQAHGQKAPAAANGFFMMISFLARSSVVVVVGLFGDWLGLKVTYLISAGIGVLGIPFIFWLPKD